MAIINFTPNLKRYFSTESVFVQAESVKAALNQLFVEHPRMRGYILDDQGCLRKHVNIFVNNELIVDRVLLSDAVESDSEIFVMQALSGG